MGYWVNYSGDILSLEFIVNILFINTLSGSQTLGNLGKISILPEIIDISFGIELSSYGQWPYSISYSTTPNDQISALESYY